ncbi:MAG: hypothetical protein IJW81_10825 [Clostridia bacterium]|nr:hypothetical protein [Clostridia bacterium]
MKYRRVSTHFVGFEGSEWMKAVKQEPIPVLNTGVFADVCAENGEELVIGQMVSRKETEDYALFICGADDPKDKAPKEYTVTFRADDRDVKAISNEGELALTKREDGSYAFTMKSSGSVLITAK